MRFPYHKLLSDNNRNNGFLCFFATNNAAWNKPLLKRKFGSSPVFKITLSIKTSIIPNMHENLPEHYGLLSFIWLPEVVPGLDDDSFDPAYICLFKSQFIPPGFREKLQALVKLTQFEVLGKDYQNGTQLFLRILHEQTSGYLYKHDLIRTYLAQLVHLALKMK
jgi:hypothetical protein